MPSFTALIMPFNDKTATVVPSCVVGKLGLNSFEGGTMPSAQAEVTARVDDAKIPMWEG
jgi:hypothetical protein